jgi:hypothetical protein
MKIGNETEPNLFSQRIDEYFIAVLELQYVKKTMFFFLDFLEVLFF